MSNIVKGSQIQLIEPNTPNLQSNKNSTQTRRKVEIFLPLITKSNHRDIQSNRRCSAKGEEIGNYKSMQLYSTFIKIPKTQLIVPYNIYIHKLLKLKTLNYIIRLQPSINP
eukprot:TRINITY_DN31889_c3_g1_i1.p1 TRINITY_DN31889_c3_g1~~TRINITY_DN31889_c3_g1_i1.p1  ORF type:complete len:111 (+),score=2.84 TRINITY_DN31889_c3_g1_i1:427-759(+)